ARPQQEVKEKAWLEVIEDDTLPNIMGRAITGGFVALGQAELLKPYTKRYFEAIPGVWERRSSEVAQTVVVGLYPSRDISQDGLDAADEFLAGDMAPALRRLVMEGKAGVVRALKARAFDAS
ncbi:MAG: ERAP1-like C-terminal domain-containing protein, partial [Mycobacteriaceae bacterium]|nr:ERAP1-like C-terminal domain-containing protein [Mycobacteriaceae bacterium]